MVVGTNRDLLIERLGVRGMYLRNGELHEQTEGAHSIR
jgi:hypothetical protein